MHTIRPSILRKEGLEITEIREGDNKSFPLKGDEVTINFTARLENGEIVDMVEDSAEPYKFKVGKQEIIKGLDEGIEFMSKG